MKARQRHQLKIRVDPEDARRVREYCAARNITETALFRAALKQYLTGTSLQDVLFRRLDRIAHEISRVATGVELLGETLGTFVQFWLAHNPEIDEHEKPAAQRDVARRYRRFVGYVVRAVRDERNTLLHRLIGTPIPIGDEGELDSVRARVGEELTPSAVVGGGP